MKPYELLTVRAASLARADSRAWEDFLRAFAEYSSAAATVCVNSPPDKLQTAQGSAQMTARLLELFRNAPVEADKITASYANKK